MLEVLGSASTVFSGAFYSVALAAIFGPAELFVRSAAHAIAPREVTTARATATWLNENGFESSVGKSLMRTVAVLGPLLAGVLQNLANTEP
jgi:hypothetical protein